MPKSDYSLLKQTLKLEVAAGWLLKDAEDDFYPDTIYYSEFKDGAADYIKQKAHRLFQFDTVPFHREYVPKKTLLLREAIWLPPAHRILYLAILQHIFQSLDAKLLDCSYSYRCNHIEEGNHYPFGDKKQGWIRFQNDFRKAALSST
jgi:hypothetical protein